MRGREGLRAAQQVARDSNAAPGRRPARMQARLEMALERNNPSRDRGYGLDDEHGIAVFKHCGGVRCIPKASGWDDGHSCY